MSSMPPLFYEGPISANHPRYLRAVVLRFCLNLRDLEELMAERSLAVDHTTIWRWIQRLRAMKGTRSATHGPDVDSSNRAVTHGLQGTSSGNYPAQSTRANLGLCGAAGRSIGPNEPSEEPGFP
jgi:hypothetical protein